MAIKVGRCFNSIFSIITFNEHCSVPIAFTIAKSGVPSCSVSLFGTCSVLVRSTCSVGCCRAKALVHLLELLVDGLKAFRHPLLQSVLKLLVHRVAYLVQLAGVLSLQCRHALDHGAAQLLHLLVVGLLEALQTPLQDALLAVLPLVAKHVTKIETFLIIAKNLTLKIKILYHFFLSILL